MGLESIERQEASIGANLSGVIKPVICMMRDILAY